MPVSDSAAPFRTLALLAQKGGAGKTTLAVHLAVALGRPDRTVALIDTDPQRSAAAWHAMRQAPSPALIECKAERVRAVLAQAKAAGAGLAIVDTRPSAEADVAAVARAADLILIPVRPSFVDLAATGATVEVVKAARTPACIVLNTCPPRIGAGEAGIVTEARRALADYRLPIIAPTVGERVSLRHALASGQAVAEFDPASKGAAEIALLARFVELQLWPEQQQ